MKVSTSVYKCNIWSWKNLNILMIILYHEILIPFHILCIQWQCIYETTRINNVHMIFGNIYSCIGNLFVCCLFFFCKTWKTKDGTRGYVMGFMDAFWFNIIICRYGAFMVRLSFRINMIIIENKVCLMRKYVLLGNTFIYKNCHELMEIKRVSMWNCWVFVLFVSFILHEKKK